MDYEFLRDITGVVKVRMSMGHEVVGHWFNEEVKENLALLDEVEQAAHALKGSERSWQRAGHEYTLWMDGERMNEIGGMGGKLRDMEKASIIMELLARLIRPDEKKKSGSYWNTTRRRE